MTSAARARRRMNRRLYKLFFRLFRLAFPNEAPAGRVSPARVRRVLLARTDRLGDAVVLTPMLNYLRAVLPPGAEIDVVTSAAGSLLGHDPRVTRVHVPARGWLGWLRDVRALRARQYDVVLSLRLADHFPEGITAACVAPRTAVRASILRPVQHVGLFTHQVRLPPSQRNVRARLLYLAQAVVGDGPAPRAADLARYPASLPTDAAAEARVAARAAERWGGRPYVAFNAWGSDVKRCFGPARAAEVAVAIAERHPELAVVLTPPPSAMTEAEEIVRRAEAALAALPAGARPGLPARVALAPPSRDLRDLVALLRGAAVVLTPDTANMHMASAVGAPLVAVYTAYTAVPVWGAWGEQPLRVVHLPGDRPLADVPVAWITDAFAALWGEVRRPAAAQRTPSASTA